MTPQQNVGRYINTFPKTDIIAQLQKDILPLGGFKSLSTDTNNTIGFKPIESSFPNSTFPVGCVHEFVSMSTEDTAVSSGFIAGLLGRLMHLGGVCVWISTARTIFPPSLKIFGIEPDQVIFIDLKKEKDVLWAMEEMLKCGKLTAVLGELKEISFTESRRLQLAVEQSRVTGFILRQQPRLLNTVACVSRWRITSLPSVLEDGMPGVGFPRWNVELLKVRNGTPGKWEVEWVSNQFREVTENIVSIFQEEKEKSGRMNNRFVAIWFRYLKTDWMMRHQPCLKEVPFVLAIPDHGRMKISEVSVSAKSKGIEQGMIVADAKIIFPGLQTLDDTSGLSEKLLKKLCFWSIRYTPVVTIDPPNGLILYVSGCAHLWDNEELYLKDIITKLKTLGFHVRAAMADTIGAAWAVCRYGRVKAIIQPGEQMEALMPLPPAALRLDGDTLERLDKLGLNQISSFIRMQRSALRRRFGEQLLLRLDQALGNKEEFIEPVIPVEPYSERLPSLEPIQTATGIEIALKRLLEILCKRLRQEGKGLRVAEFKGHRLDNKIEQITISTNHPSNDVTHLFKLFELKVASIEPALGIELFILTASKVEDITPLQQSLWTGTSSLQSKEVTELLDRLESKFGNDIIHRYLPDEHHLPERSIKLAGSLQEKPAIPWRGDKMRPVQLLHVPEPVTVTAPVPDYPPMNFRHKNKLHIVKKADGPERIESEWWIQAGLHRDYYVVEDEEGKRYWLFRLGHYDGEKLPSWSIHGFFA